MSTIYEDLLGASAEDNPTPSAGATSSVASHQADTDRPAETLATEQAASAANPNTDNDRGAGASEPSPGSLLSENNPTTGSDGVAQAPGGSPLARLRAAGGMRGLAAREAAEESGEAPALLDAHSGENDTADEVAFAKRVAELNAELDSQDDDEAERDGAEAAVSPDVDIDNQSDHDDAADPDLDGKESDSAPPAQSSPPAEPPPTKPRTNYIPSLIKHQLALIETLEAEQLDHLTAGENTKAVEVLGRIRVAREELVRLTNKRQAQRAREANRKAAVPENPLDPHIIEHHAGWDDHQILAEFIKEIRADESGKGLVAGVATRLYVAAARLGHELPMEVLKEQTFAECWKTKLRIEGIGKLFCTRGNEIKRRLAERDGGPAAIAGVRWLRRRPLPSHEQYRSGDFERDWQAKWLDKWLQSARARVTDGNVSYPWEARPASRSTSSPDPSEVV